MKPPHDRLGIASALALTASVFFCGCKSTQTVTTERVRHPIIEKYASNFDNSDGVTKSDVVNPFDGKKFEGSKGFNIEEFAAEEYDVSSFEGQREFKGFKHFEDTPAFAVDDNRLADRKSKFNTGRESSFGGQEAFENSSVTHAGDKPRPFRKMFATKEMPERESDYDSYIGGALDASGSTAMEEQSEASVGDIRSLLNKN